MPHPRLPGRRPAGLPRRALAMLLLLPPFVSCTDEGRQITAPEAGAPVRTQLATASNVIVPPLTNASGGRVSGQMLYLAPRANLPSQPRAWMWQGSAFVEEIFQNIP